MLSLKIPQNVLFLIEKNTLKMYNECTNIVTIKI